MGGGLASVASEYPLASGEGGGVQRLLASASGEGVQNIQVCLRDVRNGGPSMPQPAYPACQAQPAHPGQAAQPARRTHTFQASPTQRVRVGVGSRGSVGPNEIKPCCTCTCKGGRRNMQCTWYPTCIGWGKIQCTSTPIESSAELRKFIEVGSNVTDLQPSKE